MTGAEVIATGDTTSAALTEYNTSPEQVVPDPARAANDNGGKDNISVISG